jgi:CheY-like chemotaxis protein
MPEINGRELYRRILDRRPGLAPRIVFLTAETTDPDIRSFLATCKAPTLFKPFTLNQLDRFLADRLTLANAIVN